MRYLILTLFLVFGMQNALAEGSIIKKKSYSKNFTINANTLVSLSSAYGDIRYEIGTTNKVSYYAEVIVDGNKESSVDQKLNSISVEFSTRNNQVLAETKFGKLRLKGVNVKVNYVITLPKNAKIGININYGNIYFPNLTGEINISANYTDVKGNPTLKNLSFSGNYCDFIGGISVDKLDIHSNYSDFKLGTIGELTYSGNYTDISLENLLETSSLRGNYSDFVFRNLASTAKNIEISGNYLDAKIHANGHSQINFEGQYTDASYPSDFNVFVYTKKYSRLEIKAKNNSQPKTFISGSGNFNDFKIY